MNGVTSFDMYISNISHIRAIVYKRHDRINVSKSLVRKGFSDFSNISEVFLDDKSCIFKLIKIYDVDPGWSTSNLFRKDIVFGYLVPQHKFAFPLLNLINHSDVLSIDKKTNTREVIGFYGNDFLWLSTREVDYPCESLESRNLVTGFRAKTFDMIIQF